MAAAETRLTIRVSELPESSSVDGLLWQVDDARALLVLAHGAGAGMRHRGMEALATVLAGRGIATLRYQFPYMQAGGRRPDRPPKLTATVRAAVDVAHDVASGLPVFAGGRSMGGRMTSTAQSERPLPGVRGLIFFAYPLHPAGKPATSRADHLESVDLPMLFLQGTRDRLADAELISGVLADKDHATLHWLDGADHGFGVLKRSGRTPPEVLEEIGDAVSAWIDRMT